MPRFELDEDDAREWLEDELDYTGPGSIGLFAQYNGASYEQKDMRCTEQIVAFGQQHGLGDTERLFDIEPWLHIEFSPMPMMGPRGVTFRWLLTIDEEAGFGFASDLQDLEDLEGPEHVTAHGVESAMQVLREAVRAGNKLAEGLADYVKENSP